VNDSNQLVVLAKNLNQANVVWQYSPTNGDQLGPFSLINGYLYFGGSSGNYYVQNKNIPTNVFIVDLSASGRNYNGITSTSVLLNGNVYFTIENALMFVPQGTGNATFATNLNSNATPPTVTPYSTIIFGDTAGIVLEYNPVTGFDETLFRTFTSLQTSLTVADGVYTTTNINSTVWLYDPTQPYRTQFTISGKVGNPSQNFILTSPAYVGNGSYIVGSADSNAYWVRASNSTGTYTGWSLTVLGSNATAGGIVQSIAVMDGLAFVCTNTTAIYAFDTTTRTQKWFNNQTPPATCPPVAYNESVYIGTTDGIFILNSQTGTLRTKITLTGIKYVVVDTTNGDVYATRISGTAGQILKINPFPY
jgi:hypothetical protein